MEELTIIEKTICICGFIICPIIMFLVAKDIKKQIKDMREFGDSIFRETGEIEEKDITGECKLLE